MFYTQGNLTVNQFIQSKMLKLFLVISSEILELGSIVALNLVAMCKTLSRCHTNAWQFYSGVSVQKTLLYWLGLIKYMCDRSWNTVRQFGPHICFMRLMKSKGCSDILRVGCRVSNHLATRIDYFYSISSLWNYVD